MRKWGLHYLLYLVVVALVLAGCGASSNNSDSAANTESAFRNEAASDGSAESAPAAVEGKKDSLANTAMAVNDQAAVKGGGGNSALPGTDAGQGADASAGFTGTDVVAGLNKKLIYKANLNMEVSDYGAAQTEVRNMVTLAGGYIIEFSENMSEYEQGGTFILKVPAAGFSPFLNNLEKIKHEKLQRSIQGQDVSEEYVDLESRLKAKQMMEAQYIDFMKKRPNRLISSSSPTSLGKSRSKSNRSRAECGISIRTYRSLQWSFASTRLRRVLPLHRLIPKGRWVNGLRKRLRAA